VEYDSSNGVSKRIDEAEPGIVVREKDYFVFARRDQERNAILNYSWLIAAWVNPEHRSVLQVRNEAARIRNGNLPGYPEGRIGPAAANEVRSQVQTLYEALYNQRARLAYGNRTLPPFQEANQYGQLVKLPDKTMADGVMNCLDSAVLFASLLASCDLNPGILFLPGHAMAAWQKTNSPGSEWEYIEVHHIFDWDFERARDSAADRVAKIPGNQAITECRSVDMMAIADLSKFVVLVDIRSVWQAGINRLPLYPPVSTHFT
jgi:hypothetical protein